MTLPGISQSVATGTPPPPPPVVTAVLKKAKGEKKSEIEERVEEDEPISERPPAIRVVEPERSGRVDEGTQKILVTTTQKIEGKKIKRYYGLVNANIVIKIEDPAEESPDEPDTEAYSMNASYRSRMKTGVLLALRELRGEAGLLGANGVIATSFNFHRIDPRSILLTAVGTAVHIEGPS
ncbi:MAG: heavy metal-binding domain-containing protein [Nitrospirae bacterium]|nr:heavy metal-binding domain-containing protein [Candidatus Manganitrophaceae bacterium]